MTALMQWVDGLSWLWVPSVAVAGVLAACRWQERRAEARMRRDVTTGWEGHRGR